MVVKNYDKINQNPSWFDIPDNPYMILIIGGSVLGKSNVLLSLLKHQPPDVDKIYLYVKDQLLISRREKVGNKELKNPKVFFEYV